MKYSFILKEYLFYKAFFLPPIIFLLKMTLKKFPFILSLTNKIRNAWKVKVECEMTNRLGAHEGFGWESIVLSNVPMMVNAATI